MRNVAWFFAGVVAVALVACGSALVLLKTQTNGFGTRIQPTLVEPWLARRIRVIASPTGAKERRNPLQESPRMLAEARVHWADHCAVCHSNNGSGDVEMGKHLYPRAPDMRQDDTQMLSDGELFYIIQNGIRFTGMPAWGNGSAQDERDSWKLVWFIRHLPKLTAGEEREMRELNPKSPEELKEEEEEQDFLNGREPHEQTGHTHN